MTRRYAKKTYKGNGEKWTQKEKAHRYYLRHKEEILLNNKKWHAAHPEKSKEYCKHSYAKNIVIIRERKKQFYYDHPEIRIAQNMTKNEPKAAKCEFCDSTTDLHRHHPDYNYPAIFVTACSKCHYYLNNQEIVC